MARAYAGHSDGGHDAGTTTTYIRASLQEVAAALAALIDEPHPLARSLSPSSIGSTTRGLLIRGLGVQVPRGAPVIKALAWRFPLDRGLLRVHSGRSGAPWVLGRRWTVPVPVGRNGLHVPSAAEWGWRRQMVSSDRWLRQAVSIRRAGGVEAAEPVSADAVCQRRGA